MKRDLLLIVVNDANFFLSHRLQIAKAALSNGFDVHVATPVVGSERIRALGLVHHSIILTRSGRNVFTELRALWGLVKLFIQLQPDVVHLVTIKPVLYGGLAARFARVPSLVAAISGLGAIFIGQSPWAKLLRYFVKKFYKVALAHRNLCVILQNPSDKDLFVKEGLVVERSTRLIRGSGVDLTQYIRRTETLGELKVVMAARLLHDKGAVEFVEAVTRLRARGYSARFQLAGTTDTNNPASLDDAILLDWKSNGVVEILGHCSDIASLFAESHIVVLPSYREGVPKVLLEAAACGRAVVTTDVPGCRDAIENGVTGLLVPAKNAEALADAIARLIDNPEERIRMGIAGRALAEREFDVNLVAQKHIEIYRELLSKR